MPDQTDISVFVPFVKLKEHAANFLTNAVYDPSSGIPEYKVCAVRIERAEHLVEVTASAT